MSVYPCTYYPNATDPETATSVVLAPGSVLSNIDVELHPANGVRVSGRLENGASGKPASSGLVGLNPRTNSSTPPVGGAANFAAALCSNMTVEVKDPSGRFEIRNVPSGTYWAQGQIQEDDKFLTGRVPVEVADADMDGVVVTAGEGAELKGRVRVEPDAPVDFSRLRISLGLLDESALPWLSLQPKSDGSFELSGAPPATYRLTVKGLPAGYYLKSARLAGVDVLDAGVSLDSTNHGSLDVILASPGGTISGEVREGDRAVPAAVYVAPEPLRLNRPDLFFFKSTNDDGSFTFAGVPPGNYRLFAFREPDPNLLSNPVLFQPYEAKGESVSVDDGASQSVQLD